MDILQPTVTYTADYFAVDILQPVTGDSLAADILQQVAGDSLAMDIHQPTNNVTVLCIPLIGQLDPHLRSS